ncbi:Endoplasmic reticulum-Golgi intermediate compartment protein 3 [Phlyctochytrium planicorne]|nr:Endoplasmic reticulum-Golgi intermediate compartment protein 3 [Phlyctochytrium planicorne]
MSEKERFLRHRHSSQSDINPSPAKGIIQSLKELDAYAKPLDDFRIKTSSGALVTLISGAIILLLLISEFVDWQTVQVHPSLDVDRARKEKMNININITFPRVPCYLLSIDVMDVAGEHQNDVDHSIIKARLDPNGNVVVMEKGSIGDGGGEAGKAMEKAVDPNYCGDCYGGVLPEGTTCCNTCDDVRRAYNERGWSFSEPDKVEQCIREGFSQKIKEQANEGCNMHGYIEVNKVAGNFHFAPGKSFQQGSVHVHDLHSYQSNDKFDFSHHIHTLSFGKRIDFSNPLDNVAKGVSNDAFMYQYFIKVVSTKYQYRNGTMVNTNQIAVTEHERDLSAGNAMGLPGVFFNFEISPMLVTYQEYKKPFSHFLTDICAIVGGVFTVAGIVDSIIYTAEKTLKKKMELGKAH